MAELPDIIQSKLLDKWSPVHGAAGFALGKFLGRENRPLGIALLVGFELLENTPVVRSRLRGKESKGNSLVDIGVGIIGLFAGSRE